MLAAKTDAFTTHQRTARSSPGQVVPLRRRCELVPASDADLARAVLAEQPGAFRLLWERFSPAVRRTLWRALGTDVDVDDIVQEVFLTVLESIHRLREPAAVGAFILSITRHAFRRALRRRRVRACVPLEIAPQESTAICVSDAAAQHAFVHLQVVLGRLGERDRRAFILRFVERMNIEEVAEALGVSLSTARRYVAHAWKRVTFFADRDLFLADYLADSSTRDLLQPA